MLVLRKVIWYIGVLFLDWCPNPSCVGLKNHYDDHPSRDFCSTCGKSAGEIEADEKIQ